MTSVPAKRSPTRICVFTSATTGHSPLHIDAARDLAQTFHEHSIQLVYVGGTTGLMGELAATLVNLSGKDSVQGVIPASIITLERPDGAARAEKDSKDKLRKRWTGPVNFVSRLQSPQLHPLALRNRHSAKKNTACPPSYPVCPLANNSRAPLLLPMPQARASSL